MILFGISSLLVLGCGAKAQAQRSRVAVGTAPTVIQQPLYTDYKGVRLGMPASEVRAKLGQPTLLALKENEVDYFVVSESEAVQIGYDAALKVKVISVDYQNGSGAPEPRAVVGAELETRENGTLYRIVYYDSLGFWVSYNRTAGPVNMVSITIQKK